MLNTLNVAQTGLNASKFAVENIANNIANESTPGYKKRVTNLSEISNLSMSAGQGVSYSISRITAEFMYSNLTQETSKYNYNAEISQILENAESLFAETEDSGFSANLNRYYQAVENLRSEPSNEIYQTDLANNGKFLVESLQKLYEGIERIELVKESELKANIEKVNNILGDIGKINEKLADYNEVSVDLLDKRDNLEAELSKYVDIEVSNFNGEYELKIAGQTAVRYSTNIRSISLDNIQESQVDKFSLTDSNGVILDGIKKFEDSDGNIVSRTFEEGDKITYTLNSNTSVSVSIGQTLSYYDEDGLSQTLVVSEDNLIQSMAIAINKDDSMRSLITAYNGNPEYDNNGNLIVPSQDKFLVIKSDKEGLSSVFDSRISIEKIDNQSNISRENIYRNELSSIDASNRNIMNIFGSEVKLESGLIKAQIEVTDSTSSLNYLKDFKKQLDVFANTLSDISNSFYRDNISGDYIYGTKSADELNQNEILDDSLIKVSVSDPTALSSITLNFNGTAHTYNVVTPSNDLEDLATKLQNEINGSSYGDDTDIKVRVENNKLVFEDVSSNGLALSDPSKKIFTYDDFSVAGTTAQIVPEYEDSLYNLNLFSGSDVKSLNFNSDVINDLDQIDLDYLASLQWKDDVSFTQRAQDRNNNDSVSISEFYQSIRVSISSEKESADFILTTQSEVKQSLEATYESLVKVDKDEEMTALIQFQAAYTANAKVITIIDEMLQTLLGIKR